MKIDDKRKIYTVSEVNYFAKETLEQLYVWVEAEISRCDKSPNYDFYYITLKDERSILPAIIDGFLLRDAGIEDELVGKKIIAYGYLSLYEARGQYQLRATAIEQAGEGKIARKLEQTIKKLKKEGLFDSKHKKELPLYPKRVCIITSYNSDAFNDFKAHSVEKFAAIELSVADIRVQGHKSAGQLLSILPKVDGLKFDAVVITRGGGSLEDLAAFNDEQVARVIFAMKTPTVVAIGHEMNESLAEWVADKRASTPTDAANIICAGYILVLDKLESLNYKLTNRFSYYFDINFQNMDHSYYKLTAYSKQIIISSEARLAQLEQALSMLSPENVLKRGYTITLDSQGHIIKNVVGVVVGDKVGVKFIDGQIITTVTKKIRNDQSK